MAQAIMGTPFPANGNHTFNVVIPLSETNSIISNVGSVTLLSVDANGVENPVKTFHRSQVESGFHAAGVNFVLRATHPAITVEVLS